MNFLNSFLVLISYFIIGCGSSHSVDINSLTNTKQSMIKLESTNDYNGTLSQYTFKNNNAIFYDIDLDSDDNQYVLLNYDLEKEDRIKGVSSVVKLDKDQNILWQYTIDGDKLFYVFASIELFNNYIYVVGNVNEKASIVKLDLNGNLIWQRVFDSNDKNMFLGLKITDNGIYAAGRIIIDNIKEDAIVVKYSQSGEMLWSRVVSGLNDEGFYDVALDNKGFVYCVGYSLRDSTDENHGQNDGLIVKLEPNSGQPIWNRLFGDIKNDNFIDIDCMIDQGNGCYVVGNMRILEDERYILSGYLLKIDQNGDKISDRYFRGSSDTYINRVFTHDSDIYVVGNTFSSDGDFSSIAKNRNGAAIIMKLDNDMNISNIKYFDTESHDDFSSSSMNSNGVMYGLVYKKIYTSPKKYIPYFLKFNMR